MIYCDKEFVAEKIKNARKKAKLKQSELSEKIGISEKHLSKIETGKNFPALDNFLKIAEILNLSLDDFGVNTKQSPNKDRDQLLKLILSANDSEIKAYLDIVLNVKNIMHSGK